jgi:sortase A
LNSSIVRVVQRLFLGVGIAALAYAGGAVAYAGIFERYQFWKFEQQRAGAILKTPDQNLQTVNVITEPRDIEEGDVIGTIEIPRLGISVMLLHGLEERTLILGAGHVPGTPLPGGDGNVAIAGHRDTFFRKLEGVIPGDSIQVATKHQQFEYIVDSTEIVDPEDTQAMESRARPELTLITCYPFYFVGAAPKRFIVHARPRR